MAGAVVAFPPAGITLPGSPMAHNEFPGDVDSPDAGIRVSRRIADELRRTRVAHDLSIEDVAATLRIRVGFIKAMEEDRFDDLPGPAYISGFLRTYANHLGLDGDQLVAWFKDDSQSTFAPREMELPVPISEIRRPTFPIITVSLVIAIGIAAAWYFYQESRSIDIDLIPEVPGPVAEGISTDAPDDESSAALDGDDVFATVGDGNPEPAAIDALPASVEPTDDTERVAEAPVPPDTSSTAGDAADDGVADALPDGEGMTEFDGVDDDVAGADAIVLPDIIGISGDGNPDTGDDDAADVVPESAGMALDGGPDDTAAGAAEVVLPDAAAISGDGGQDAGDEAAPEVPPDDANDAVEAGLPDDESGTAIDVALQDVADASGAETGGEETWDEPVFASGDTVQEPEVADGGETDSQHTVYGTPGAGSRIELRAIAETWVQVTAPDGVAVLTHILLPGDVYHVPDRDDLMLDTGNAGGLEIRVDGELIPSLGGAGAVVRDVLLSVEGLTRR